MDHFIGIYRYVIHPNYTINMTRASRFVHSEVHKSQDNEKLFFDRLEVDCMIFNPNEEYRHTRPFDKIYWYSGWIKCVSKMVYRHFSKRVMR